jgi:uncharacterized delta-60 repeat protein
MLYKKILLFPVLVLVAVSILGCHEAARRPDIPTGTLDLTFGDDGMINSSGAGGSVSAVGNSVAVTDSNRVIVAGYQVRDNGDESMAVWQYLPDGSVDTSFGLDGISTSTGISGSKKAWGYHVLKDQNSKVVVAGFANDSHNNPRMALWRFDAAGMSDLNFGPGGIVTSQGMANALAAMGLSAAIDSSGRILVAGMSSVRSGLLQKNYVVIWRYNSDGSLDSSFGNSGIATTEGFANGTGAAANGIVLDASGRILATGFAQDPAGNPFMALWRFNSDGTLDTTFATNGMATNSVFTTVNDIAGFDLALDSSGRIIVVGEVMDTSANTYMTLWRYLADGTLDSSFGASGIVMLDGPYGTTQAGSNALALDAWGNILVCGNCLDSNNKQYMALWRISPDGTIDPTFGSNGMVTSLGPAGIREATGTDLTTDSYNRIVVSGLSDDHLTGDLLMTTWRYE